MAQGDSENPFDPHLTKLCPFPGMSEIHTSCLTILLRGLCIRDRFQLLSRLPEQQKQLQALSTRWRQSPSYASSYALWWVSGHSAPWSSGLGRNT